MVDFGCLGQATLGSTLLTEGMSLEVPGTELRPAVVVATVDPLGTLIAIVARANLLGMFITVSLMS